MSVVVTEVEGLGVAIVGDRGRILIEHDEMRALVAALESVIRNRAGRAQLEEHRRLSARVRARA